MTERFVFHPHTPIWMIQDRLLNTSSGIGASNDIIAHSSSLTEVLQNTQTICGSSVVHVPGGNNYAFINVSKSQFSSAFFDIAKVHGFDTN